MPTMFPKSERIKVTKTPLIQERKTQKTTPAISRNIKKRVEKTGSSAVPRNPHKDKSHETNLASSAFHLKSATEKKSSASSNTSHKQLVSVTQTSVRTSAITRAQKLSSTQSITKESHIAQLYTTARHLEHGSRAVNSNVLSTAQHSLKIEGPPLDRTVLELKNSSKPPSNPILNSTIKVQPSNQFHSNKILRSNIRQNSSLSLLKTPLFSAFNQSKDNNQTKNAMQLCYESQTSNDVSPPSGTAIALGPVLGMRACIHLSCDVGGDVAYMRNLQCFVITCDSTERCEPRQLKAGDVTSDKVQVALLRKRYRFEEGRLFQFLPKGMLQDPNPIYL